MMRIERSIGRFCVFSEDAISDALQKINRNKSGIVFVVGEHGHLEGLVTDGDIRRWLVSATEIDLNKPVSAIINRDFAYDHIDTPAQRLKSRLDNRIRYLPLVDDSNHLVAVATRESHRLVFGDFVIEPGAPAFLIAEIGNNHNGSVDLARRLVDEAVAAGADCAKFQLRLLDQVYRTAPDGTAGEDLGAQYQMDLLYRFNLTPEAMGEVFAHCRERGILPLCTPWDLGSVEVLDNLGAVGFKVASADLTNHDLLRAIAQTGKPMLVSTGMSQESEIRETVELLKSLDAAYILLHCNSTYPTPFKDVELAYMDRLAEIGDCFVGYSGHERGYSVPVAAVARGAQVIEKHFTLDRNMEGSDHKVSLLPGEFADMVTSIRNVEAALGSGGTRRVSQGELMNREMLAKSVVAARDITAGEELDRSALAIRSPGQGLQPNRRDALIGRKAKRAMSAGEFFFESDLAETGVAPRAYSIERAWGLPVRYHDVGQLQPASNMSFVEYHLSYRDMEVDLDATFSSGLPVDLTVHSPELFAGDHIIDLAAEDPAYRQRSLHELNRVCAVARALRRYHRPAAPTLIITNMGGFSENGPFDAQTRRQLYDRLADSLGELDQREVEVIAQTMPPFPWHFGGQRYHNLFVDPDETAAFCRAHGLRLCLDVSHAKLACHHHGWSLETYIETIAPYVAHLHIADASGLDAEGLQIGEGEIDFTALGRALGRYLPDTGFIPEVWQGHKNGGEGFWLAMERLEGKL